MINFFPEKQYIYNAIEINIFYQMTIFTYYKNIYIYKNIEKNKLPYHLKPLVKLL